MVNRVIELEVVGCCTLKKCQRQPSLVVEMFLYWRSKMIASSCMMHFGWLSPSSSFPFAPTQTFTRAYAARFRPVQRVPSVK